jgi:hypothetical protein
VLRSRRRDRRRTGCSCGALKYPPFPADAQAIVSPLVSVMVTIVLLNVALDVRDPARDALCGSFSSPRPLRRGLVWLLRPLLKYLSKRIVGHYALPAGCLKFR